MFAYEFPISVDLGKLDDKVGDLVKDINSTLATFGVTEQIGVGCTVTNMTLSVSREATSQELNEVKRILEAELKRSCPELAFIVGSPRRQSGNVSLSAS